MNRRIAIKGILGLAGLGCASVIGVKYGIGHFKQDRGKLEVQSGLIAELADLILPPTRTPGAKEAVVQEYIISYMEDCSPMKEYNNFLNGLVDLQEHCENKYNHSFEKCSLLQKNKILESLDNEQDSKSLFSKIYTRIQGRSFFVILKSLTIEGYCISELGATQHLEYQAIPGKYSAISPLKVNQKSWATK